MDADAEAFCREIEAHLCRRNAGHLVRLVGPAFEMVAGWAAHGIPLKVAVRGIDACVDRRTAKGPSRRPIRVEFCEADVLDAFDQWRRAVGVGTAGAPALPAGEGAAGIPPGGHGQPDDGLDEPRPRPGHSLRAHLDRVVTRLTDCVAAGSLPPELEQAAEAIIEALAREREPSRTLRGEARSQLTERLREADRGLIAVATGATPPQILAALSKEAEHELGGFKDRMAAGDYARAVGAATAKLVREYWRLPEIAYDT